jgi:hypothetical protein
VVNVTSLFDLSIFGCDFTLVRPNDLVNFSVKSFCQLLRVLCDPCLVSLLLRRHPIFISGALMGCGHRDPANPLLALRRHSILGIRRNCVFTARQRILLKSDLAVLFGHVFDQ